MMNCFRRPRLGSCVALIPLLCAACAQQSLPTDHAAPQEDVPPATGVSIPPQPVRDADGFSALRLADFEPFPAEPSHWSEAEGTIRTTGQPKGYIYSKETYRNFTWKAEFRYPVGEALPAAELEKSNTGFMLFIQEPHHVWPRSLEVQGKFSELGMIKSNGGAPAVQVDDNEIARQQLRRPVGEWNTIEIDCDEGNVIAKLNGAVVARSAPGELTDGRIGLQAENYAVEFRGLRIRSRDGARPSK